MNPPSPFSDAREFSISRSPCVEGCNVGTWIGFKHVTYLAQEGILQWLQTHDLGMGPVFERHALAAQVVGCRLRFLKALRVDDEPTIAVAFQGKAGDSQARFAVEVGDDEGRPFARGQMRVGWSNAGERLDPPPLPPPDTLRPFIDPSPTPPLPTPTSPRERDAWLKKLQADSPASHVQCHRVAYPWCCYTDRMQFSAYVQLVEGAVDEFLAARGVSIATLLRERRWIPVVTRFNMEILTPVLMEDWLYCVFQVREVAKNLLFTANVDCYVVRDGELTRTATAEIDHAYLHFGKRNVEATVTPLDDELVRTITSAPAL